MAKPSYGLLVNGAHTLANGLKGAFIFNEGSGFLIHNAVDGASYTLQTTPYAWTADGVTPAESSGGCRVALSGLTASEFTIISKYSSGISAGGGFNAIASVYIDNSNGYNLGYAGGYQGKASAYVGGTLTGAVNNQSFENFVAGALNQKAIVCSAAENTSKLFINNTLEITGTWSASGVLGGATILSDCTLNYSTGATGTTGVCEYIYIYNRALSDAEIAAIYADPYAMFLAPTGNLTIDNVVAGSEYWIAETADHSNVVALSSASGGAIHINGITLTTDPMQLTVRVRKGTTAPKYVPFETQVNLTQSGASCYVIQVPDTIA